MNQSIVLNADLLDSWGRWGMKKENCP